MSKVIYLDIDQVLNNNEDHEVLKNTYDCDGSIPSHIRFFCKGDYIEISKLSLLQGLIDEFDASVVIVSSWDTFKDDAINICKFLNVPYHSNAYNTGGGIGRGRGVIEHAKDHNISPDDYIIIDDAESMYEDHSRLVNVNGRIGLTNDDIEFIKKHRWNHEY